jgi:hypothetical protein
MQLLLSGQHDHAGVLGYLTSDSIVNSPLASCPHPHWTLPSLLGCYVEVFAGAGGTDCADWAGMLLRMYAEWAQRSGCSADVVHATPCAVSSGYRHAVLKCAGNCAYGWLRGEAGVHRLVRISPYDELRRRHTSFAKVVIYPDVSGLELDSGSSTVELSRDDVRIETFRSSGPGESGATSLPFCRKFKEQAGSMHRKLRARYGL